MIKITEPCRLGRRRSAIVGAAKALFLEQGFEGTTLGDVVERGGGSLATVYKLFGNKDGLLEAVVFDTASAGDEIVRDAAVQGGTPAQILHRIAENLNAHFLFPEVVALVRIVIGRSMNDQNFARRFFERTAAKTLLSLERLFATWKESEVSMRGDPSILAGIFLSLFTSDLHSEAISHGSGVDHSPKRLRARTEFFVVGAGLSDA